MVSAATGVHRSPSSLTASRTLRENATCFVLNSTAEMGKAERSPDDTQIPWCVRPSERMGRGQLRHLVEREPQVLAALSQERAKHLPEIAGR